MKIRPNDIKRKLKNNKVATKVASAVRGGGIEAKDKVKAKSKSFLSKNLSRLETSKDKISISREARNSSAGDKRGAFALADKLGTHFGLDSIGPTQRAESKDRDATVAVFDNFTDADKPGVSTHGEQVEGVIQQEAGLKDEDIQRYQINSGGSINDLTKRLQNPNDEDALVDYIEDRYTGLLDNTSDGIEEILSDKSSKIKTINQSQSVAEGRIVRDLLGNAKEDPKFRANLAEHLGFDGRVSERDLTQALVDDVSDIARNSDSIAESKERFDNVSRRAADAGISHVITSGNLGDFAKRLDNMGVVTDDSFYKSAFVNRQTLVVGASDETGRKATSASFNSPNANADISAPGVDIGMVTQDGACEINSGTSFAAPAVAALVAQLKTENPDLSPREIEKILRQTADPIAGPANEIGHGVVNPEEATARAAA